MIGPAAAVAAAGATVKLDGGAIVGGKEDLGEPMEVNHWLAKRWLKAAGRALPDAYGRRWGEGPATGLRTIPRRVLPHRDDVVHLLRRRIEKLAEEIKSGRWKYQNGHDPIRFAVDGRLVDGYMRLLAVVLAEQGIYANVVGSPSVLVTGLERLSVQMGEICAHVCRDRASYAEYWRLNDEYHRLIAAGRARELSFTANLPNSLRSVWPWPSC